MMRKSISLTIIGSGVALGVMFGAVRQAAALNTATGPNGARVQIVRQANTFGLNGAGVNLGQVESGRPGDPQIVGDATHPNVNPGGGAVGVAQVTATGTGGLNGTGVLAATTPITAANSHGASDNHATAVAGAMISTLAANTGSAPGATLFSAAIDQVGNATGGGAIAGTQTHAVAGFEWARNTGGATSINFSFGFPGGGGLAGNSLLSQYVDWVSSQQGTLIVQAGPEQFPPAAVLDGPPDDAYNSLVVGMTQLGPGGPGGIPARYDRIQNSPGAIGLPNVEANGRINMHVVAPGNIGAIPFADINGNNIIGDPGFNGFIGTSFAAPITNGVVGLLRQRSTAVGSGLQSGRLLEKVVIMNSASKHLQDRAGVAWVNSPGATSSVNPTTDLVPLDDEMGTGQVNALAAVRQYTPSAGANVRNDLGLRTGNVQAAAQNYILPQLTVGSLVTATLTWDRVVTNATFNAAGTAAQRLTALQAVGNYNAQPFQDLDLRLRNTDTNTAVAASIAIFENHEHIYFNVPTTGNYRLEVSNVTGTSNQNFAVAWATGSSDGLAFSVDGGQFNTNRANLANPAAGLMAPFGNNPFPNDVNALGTAGPANFATEGEIFVSSRNGTNMQRLSGALGTRSRVGPHNAPPAAMTMLNPGTQGVLGLIPNDNVVGLSWGTDGTERLPSTIVFSVDPVAVGTAGSSVNFESILSPVGGAPANPFPDNPGGGDPGNEAAGDVFKTPQLDPFGLFFAPILPPAPAGTNRQFIDEIMLGLQAPTFRGDNQGREDDLDALEMDNLRLSVDPDGDGLHNSSVFFNLDRSSPSLGGLASADDIFVSSVPTAFGVFADGVFDIGLSGSDAIDALILSDIGNEGILDFQLDEALFSLDPASAASPSDIYYTDFLRPFNPLLDWKLGGSLFASAASIGLLVSDNLNALDIFLVPEPTAVALLALGVVMLASRRR